MTQKTLAIFAVFILIAGMLLVSAEAPMGNGSGSSEANTQIETTTSVQTYIKGDLNHDGTLTPDDLNILVDHLYESLNPLPNPIDYQIGDMDNDNNLDISDITLLVQKLIDLGYFKDKVAPVIQLLSPSDNNDYTTSSSYKTLSFRYQVTDKSNIASCSLILDGSAEETSQNPQKNITNSFSIDVDRGSHDWAVSCKDTFGNQGTSETRSFDINKESSSTNANTNNVITTLSNKATTTPTKYINTRTNSTNTITAKPVSSIEFNWMYVLFGILVAMIIVMLIMIMVVGRR